MYGERVGSATNYCTNFDFGLSGLAPLPHIRKLFFTNLRVDNLLLSGQNVTCTCGFVLQSDWYCQTKAAEVNNFSSRCYQAFFLPLFFRREPEDEATKSTGLNLNLL